MSQGAAMAFMNLGRCEFGARRWRLVWSLVKKAGVSAAYIGAWPSGAVCFGNHLPDVVLSMQAFGRLRCPAPGA